MHRQALLARLKHYWLERALGSEPTIEELNLPLRSRGDRLLSREDLLARIDKGTFLLLGEPGTGKTMLLLSLMRQLVEAALNDENKSVPIYLHLASWTIAKETLTTWLVEELYFLYHVPKLFGSEILSPVAIPTTSLVLLLDGLDEINRDDRHACLEQIARFQNERHPVGGIVVASRMEVNEAIATRLHCRDSWILSPLPPEAIDIPQIQQTTGTPIPPAYRTPLILALGKQIDWRNIPSPAPDLGDRLMASYIEQQCRDTPTLYSRKRIKTWLHWLALKLNDRQQSVFLLDQMQRQYGDRGWLDTRWQKLLYLVGISSIGGVMTAPVVGISSGILGGMILSWFHSPLGLAILRLLNRSFVGFAFRWLRRPLGNFLVSQIRQPIEYISRRLALRFLRRPAWELLLKFAPRMLSGTVLKRSPRLLQGAIATAGTLSMIRSRNRFEAQPKQRIWQATQSASIWAFCGAILTVLVTFPFGINIGRAAIAGFLFGVFGGALMAIEHLVLRVVLFATGRIPWNYTRFLDFAVARGLLFPIGSGYMFRHREFQKYFAQLSLD